MMNNDVSINERIESKLKYFQENDTFTDINLILPNNSIIKAHRVVLAHYSIFFNEWLKKQPYSRNLIEFNVCFDIDNLFSIMISFFYDNSIIDKPKNRSSLYALAVIYQVHSLEQIMKSQIIKDLSISTVLGYLFPFSRLKLHPNIKNQYTMIFNSFSQLYSKIDFIISYISQNIKQLSKKCIFSSINPHILYLILSKIPQDIFSDFQKIDFIESYFVYYSYQFSNEEKQLLESVIDFSDSNSYLYFNSFSLEWITDATYRRLVSILLNQRRSTLNFFKKTISNSSIYHSLCLPFSYLSDNINNNINNNLNNNINNNLNNKNVKVFNNSNQDYISNWWLFQWLTEIYQSKGGQLTEIELTNFGITLGGISKWVGPEYGFFCRPDCTKSLDCQRNQDISLLPDGIDIFSWINMFDDSPNYFKTAYIPAQVPYLGISLISSKFKVTKVSFLCDQIPQKQPKFIWIELIIEIGQPPIELEKIQVNDVFCEIEVDKTIPPIMGIRLKGGGNKHISILRCNRFKIYGYFVS